MKHVIAAFVIVSLFALPVVGQAQDADLKIVGNPGTTPDSVSKTDLARVFLKKKTKWPDGRKAVPVGRKGDADLRAEFANAILGMTPEMVESHWQAQVFSGRGTPPKALAGDAAVLDYVRNTPGAVGYVTGGANTSGVVVVNVVD